MACDGTNGESWSFLVQSFRVDWLNGSPSDSPDLGRVPTISFFEDACGETGAKHAIAYFRRLPEHVSAPSRSDRLLHLNYLASDFERILAMLEESGEVTCYFKTSDQGNWAGIRGPLRTARSTQH